MKNYSFRQVLFFAILAIGLQSCISNKAFQTARVTPQGDKGFGFGLTLPKGEWIDTSGTLVDTVNLGGFTAEIFGRFGVAEKVDVGFNLSILGTGGADVKYQFLGDSESQLAGSIGAGVGYLQFSAGADGDEASTSILDITIPAYFSYHASDAFALYLSPRYIFRKADSGSSNFGGVGGVRIGGERFGFFAEYGYLKSTDSAFSNATSFNVGMGFGIR